ncbi:MAG TPA: trypsin-like peptidase domain-containing protein [Caulobacteraceae bacterium]|nr:trypsin-like peptidase domain-containing protein [Caulobacteraceae bacterium]
MAVSKSQVLVGALAGAGVAVAAMAGAGLHGAPLGADGFGRLIKASTEPVVSSSAPMSFADIFERVSPAVVSIKVTSKVDVSALRGGQGFGFAFPFGLVPRGGGQDGGDDGDSSPADPRKAPKQMSSGSGFFISPDGFIVTNNHVIDHAEDIKVVLKDGKELKAVLVGRDEGTDLAVIRVEGHGYPFVNFEDRARPRVGDWVLAVGNPYDLGGTATAGIVSAYNRDIGEKFVDYIQIDAPINRGNSGGPTFDTYGRVIGVNTAIFSPSGGSVGIGFDIPADVAENVTQQLMQGHKIARGYIGAQIQDLSDEMAGAWGLTGRKGAVVASLVPGGPAARAGAQPGDVVVAVNGHPVAGASELTREVAKVHAGDSMHLDVYRNGKPRTLDILAGLRPSEEQLAKNGGPEGDEGADVAPGAPPTAQSRVLGMSLTPIDPESRQQYNIGSAVRGVLVQGVKSTSDAGDKGLRRGDVIVRAGDREVASANDVAAAVGDWKKAGRTSIPLEVTRGGVSLFVPIKIEG